MTYPKYIFITGPPGSRWSGISQELRKHPYIDNSDITNTRQYRHNLYSGHIGAYFGPEMEHGDWLKEGFYPDLLEKEIASIWSDNGVKILMSHNWCYYFDEIQEYYPNEIIITVTRDTKSCYTWWHEAGGWSITYPSYTWYKNDENMLEEIKNQIRKINAFNQKLNLKYINHSNIRELFTHKFLLDKFNDCLITCNKVKNDNF